MPPSPEQFAGQSPETPEEDQEKPEELSAETEKEKGENEEEDDQASQAQVMIKAGDAFSDEINEKLENMKENSSNSEEESE